MVYDFQSEELIELKKILSSSKDIYRTIVNSPFKFDLLTTSIDLGIVVLLLVDPKENVLKRVALSDTELAKGAVRVSAVPFHEIKIPMTTKDNALVQAIKTKEHQLVSDWQFLFTPALSPEQSRLNQRGASIECSLVWPLEIKDGGAMIFSFYQPITNILEDHLSFAKSYAQLVSEKLNKLS